MNLLILSAKSYDPQGLNYGDCLLLNTGTALVVYDCGCEEHAKRVETYMSDNGFSKAIVILSHNDADHFNGIPYLVEKGLVSKVYTQLFLKHKEEVLKLLDDGRVTEHSIGERIKKVYDNIASLSKQVELVDALTANEVVPGISIVGPTEEYALDTIAKALDPNESDRIDAETVINAASVQVSIDFAQTRCLLCGDASFEAIRDKLDDYSVIQLPHHGKPDTADKIFDAKRGKNSTIYLVSDNTGNSNGGSLKLKILGKIVHKTATGDIHYPANIGSTGSGYSPRRTLGIYY